MHLRWEWKYNMTTEITVNAEVSILLSPDGVDLYVGDAEIPINSYSFDWLVNEFLDAYGFGAFDEEFNDEIESLASTLQEMSEKLRDEIKQN
jgi:hypothetical protein